MKDDIFFVIKMLGLTCVVVVLMQVHMGGTTLENHFYGFLKNSIFVDYLQEATDGGVALTKKGYKKADEGVHSLISRLDRRHNPAARTHAQGPR
jgi:hypothetical protein